MFNISTRTFKNDFSFVHTLLLLFQTEIASSGVSSHQSKACLSGPRQRTLYNGGGYSLKRLGSISASHPQKGQGNILIR
jgi:hypothetical protein